MKYLKLFESQLKEAEVAELCRKYRISNWSLNTDGTVDVDGSVYLFSRKLTKLPLKFGRVVGDFDCGDNKLTSLEGSPKYVGGNFDCRWNNIESFEGIDYINTKTGFYCYNNPIYRLWRLFEDTSKIEMFNEWGIIQGDNVILYRLNDFLEEIGKPEVNHEQLEEIKKYYNVI